MRARSAIIAQGWAASLSARAAQSGCAASDLSRMLRTMKRHGRVALAPDQGCARVPRVSCKRRDPALPLAGVPAAFPLRRPARPARRARPGRAGAGVA